MSLAATPRSPNRGGFADHFVKTTIEVCLIGKAAFRRNLAHWIVGHRHQFLSACDSHSPDILARRTAKARLECAIELASAELHHLGEFSPIDLRTEVDGYVTLNAARLPRLHAIVILHRRRPHRISVDGSGFIGCVAGHAITLRCCEGPLRASLIFVGFSHTVAAQCPSLSNA
jgi:hypothetical protein